MAPQFILRQLKRTPFRPFRLHTVDGAAYDVRDPFAAYVDATQVVVGVAFHASGVASRSVYLSPDHVTRLEPLFGDVDTSIASDEPRHDVA